VSTVHKMRPIEPPVGVVAKTVNLAAALIKELNIRNGIPMSMVGNQARGVNLKALLIDEEVWPLPIERARQLLPGLAHYGGYVLRVSRHDPKWNRGHIV
jgi:hypothetical protein